MSIVIMDRQSAVAHRTISEPGQLAEVRGRHRILSDAVEVSPRMPKQYLLKLASVDEDAIGEEAKVLPWPEGRIN